MVEGKPTLRERGTFLDQTAAATASAASVDNIKETLRALCTEQLLAREQPVGRSSAGWQSILETAQRNLDCRLLELHTVPEVFAFGVP